VMSFVPGSNKPWDRERGDPLSRLIDPSMDSSQLLNDQRLSKLGDALLNLIHSLCLSLFESRPDGAKIPNRLLAQAIDSSKHRGVVPRRSDKHKKGDLVEAIFAWGWLLGKLDIRETVAFITERMGTPQSTFDPQRYASALAEVLDKILDGMGVPQDET